MGEEQGDLKNQNNDLSQTETTQVKKSTKTNEDSLQRLLEAILPLADKFLTFKKDDSEARTKHFESVSNHNRRMVYVLVSFLVAIVAFMSVLTVYGLVTGDALLFLVGTITGYLLLFIQRLVFPMKEEPSAEESIL